MKSSLVSVIIRVYDRMEDLIVCVENIRTYWNNYNYYVIVVSNGKSDGFEIPQSVKNAADCVIELEENHGHLKGNSQLLLSGIKHLPADSSYTIILEADTWIFSDALIDKYIKILDHSKSVWASSEWVKKYWSVGVDFAIIKTDFLVNNTRIFDFNTPREPESYVCTYLLDSEKSFVYIKENMPVHIPKSMRFIQNRFGGRFRSFPFSKMVTHHIEDLEEGIRTKKLLANYCVGKKMYPLGNSFIIRIEFYKLVVQRFFAIIAPQSSWLRKKRHAASG
jgi:hypothetical protein